MTRTFAQQQAQKKSSGYTVSHPHDPAECQAHQAADVVARGGSVAGWRFGSVQPTAPVHREETGKAEAKDDKKEYKEAATKVVEAALETDTGKKAKDLVLATPLVKTTTDFFTTPIGLGTGGLLIAGSLGGLAAAKQPLPFQLPAVPLDKIHPALAGITGQVIIEGPVNAPTYVGLTLTFGGGSSSKGKKGKEGQKPVQREPADTAAPAALDTSGVESVERSSGSPLEPSVRRRMESRFGYDFGGVRVHDDAGAHAAAQGVDAKAFTVGNHIGFAPGLYNPGSPDGVRLLAHELAHVVQQEGGLQRKVHRHGNPPVATTTYVDELSEADQKKIVLRGEVYVDFPKLQEYFDDPKWEFGADPHKAFKAKTAFDFRSVDKKLEHGLTIIATNLAAGATPTLPTYSTLDAKISVTQGSGTFRFTHVKPKGAKASTVVIEDISAKPAAPAATPAGKDAKNKDEKKKGEEKPAAPKVVDHTTVYDERVKKHSLKESGFAGSDLDALKAAVAKVPDAHLKKVAGLTFRRLKDANADDQASAKDKKAVGLAGVYRSKQHSVTIYDFAMTKSLTQFGDAGTGEGVSWATRWIIHEIGHAIDFADQRKASETYTEKKKAAAEATAALKAAKKAATKAGAKSTAKKPNAARDEADEAVKAAQALADAAGTERDDAATASKKATALSGALKDYQAEAAKDGTAGAGGSGISKYGQTQWKEHFAEAYAFYLTQPELMKKIRPNTHAWFEKNLPK